MIIKYKLIKKLSFIHTNTSHLLIKNLVKNSRFLLLRFFFILNLFKSISGPASINSSV